MQHRVRDPAELETAVPPAATRAHHQQVGGGRGPQQHRAGAALDGASAYPYGGVLARGIPQGSSSRRSEACCS